MSMDMQPRKMLLNDDILQKVDLESYARTAYQKTIKEAPKLTEKIRSKLEEGRFLI